jgi:hypothetical protein
MSVQYCIPHESDKDGVNDVSKVRQTYGRVDMSPTQEKI